MPRSAKEVMEDAFDEAQDIDALLAADVVKAERLLYAYAERPLRIHIPIIGVALAFKWAYLFQVSMRFKTYHPPQSKAEAQRHPLSPKEKKRRKAAKDKAGLQVSVGNLRIINPEGRRVPDEDTFSIKELAEANPPEIDYIWIVDKIRGILSGINWLADWFGAEHIKLPDWYGSVLWRSSSGPDTLYMPMVTHPKATAEYIQKTCKTIRNGTKAEDDLVGRMDERVNFAKGGPQ